MIIKKLLPSLICLTLFSTCTYAGNLQPTVSNNQLNLLTAFVENKGQIICADNRKGADILFKSSDKNADVYLMRQGISYVFRWSDQMPQVDGRNITNEYREPDSAPVQLYRVDMVLEGADPQAQIIKEEACQVMLNYYTDRNPSGIHDAKGYYKITYKNVYPHIDWVVYKKRGGNGTGELKYDFIVKPGGKPEMIRLRYTGVEQITLGKQNEANITTPLGTIVEAPPYVFQQIRENEEGKQDIPATYKLEGNILSFDLGAYDSGRVLVIDPEVRWASYCGGNGDEISLSTLAYPAKGTIVTGYTRSGDFPVSTGAIQTSNRGDYDGFIMRFDEVGKLVWATYYGGSGADFLVDAAVDNGNIVCVGRTESNNFPLSAGALQNQYGGNTDLFILMLNSEGKRVWATYYGGRNMDGAWGVAVDQLSDFVVVGRTQSSDFPVSEDVYQEEIKGDYDNFILKIDADGQRIWSTYYGGSGYDQGNGVAIDSSNNIILSGMTSSSNLPVSLMAFQTVLRGDRDAYLAKFTADGELLWATYYGGTAYEQGYDVAVGKLNTIVSTGFSFGQDIPTRKAYQANNAGVRDAYLAQFDEDGKLMWATYFGGANEDGIDDVAVDNQGNIVATGFTNSSNFPVKDALQTSLGGGFDAFLTAFSFEGELLWSTFIGGEAEDTGDGLDIDKNGDIIVSGGTRSWEFPVTAGALQEQYNGGSDAFVVRFGVAAGPSVISDVEEDCSSVSFTVTDPLAIQSITLDLQQSDNVSISVRDTTPEGSYRVELRLVDDSRAGRFEVDIINSRSQVLSYDGDLYPATGVLQVASPLVEGAVVLGHEVVGTMECGNVLLKNTSADTVTITSLACAINTSFSVPQSQFPIVIPPDSSKAVFVCYVPNDTTVQRDTLIGTMECMSVSVPLVSKGIITSVEYFAEGRCGVQLRLASSRAGDTQLRAYPAPAIDNVVIPVMQQYTGAVSAVLYNPLGVSVATGRFEPSNSETQAGRIAGAWIFSVADLPAGMYYAVIPCGEETATVAIPVAR